MNPWKRFATILLCVVCVLTGYSDGFSQLTPANSDDVIAIANNWLRLGQEVEWGWTAAAVFTPASIQEIEYQGQLVAYALPVMGGGYLITPAFQELPPITAYSTVSSLDVNQEDGFCEMIKEVLSDKILLVSEYLTNPNPPAEWQALQDAIEHHRALWQDFSGNYSTFIKAVENENFSRGMDSEDQMYRPHGILDIGPLLTSSWHQGYPYYNYCPWGDGGRCVVGCVATATAQILYYHKSPSSGIGTHTYWWSGDYSCGGSTSGRYLSATFSDSYDWNNILDRYDGGETQAQEDAVAELCYEVGVAEDMMYGACGSGTYMSNAMDAFTIHFGYSDQINYQYRTSYGSPEEWFDMLAEELNHLRPMQYHISRHSIVCDGWRVSGTNQVHMNYGWDSSHNTWYTVDELYCSWEGCSPWVEGAIRRIYPDFELLSPNGGEVWCIGEGYDITWDGSGIETDVTISLNRDYPSGAWEVLFSGTQNDGVELWDVDEPVTQNARIRIIHDDDPSIGDTSSGDFAISGFYMSLVYPNGGETWYINQPYGISWAFCDTGNVDISLNRSFPSGEWEPLFTDSPGDGFEEVDGYRPLFK